MKKLFVIATLVGFSFCIANAQTTPATNVSGTPANLSTVGSPNKKQSTGTVRPAVGAPTNLTTTSSPLKKQGTATAKPGSTKMAGKVGSPAAKASKVNANSPGKMQNNNLTPAK